MLPNRIILKLTSRNQAEALFYYLKNLLSTYKPENIAESLVHDLMNDVFDKLKKKVESRMVVKTWSLQLNHKEAKAYYIYFQQTELTGYTYEKNLVSIHCLEIDKTYA